MSVREALSLALALARGRMHAYLVDALKYRNYKLVVISEEIASKQVRCLHPPNAGLALRLCSGGECACVARRGGPGGSSRREELSDRNASRQLQRFERHVNRYVSTSM